MSWLRNLLLQMLCSHDFEEIDCQAFMNQYREIHIIVQLRCKNCGKLKREDYYANKRIKRY